MSTRGCACVILLSGAAAYFNSFSGRFFFDDYHNIVDRPAIRRLWPPGELLAVDRPLLSLSVAVNYAVSGLEVWSYHAFNLAVHLLAGLALFGVVRRTLRGGRFEPEVEASAERLALAVALLWLLHPLQTESVTYIIQRSESAMGLCLLACVYCLIRSAGSRSPWRWQVGLLAACAAGMGFKPVMAMAPLVLLIHDAVLLSPSLMAALRRRMWLYLTMGFCGGILAIGGMTRAVMFNRAAELLRSGPAFAETDHWRYARTQFEVIVHYLRLAVWPWGNPFCLDYNWPEADSLRAVAAPAALIAALLAATAAGLWRRRWWGAAGAWFFLILAPSSSLLPIEHRAFEHRMYLPLAAVAAVAAAAGWGCARRVQALTRREGVGRLAGGVMLGAAAVGLGLATVRRNQDYQSREAMWADIVAKRPDHLVARVNLSSVLLEEGRLEEAVTECGRVLAVSPGHALAHCNMGLVRHQQGRREEAIAHYRRALRSAPGLEAAHANLGVALAESGQEEEAREHLREAVRLRPNLAGAWTHLARLALRAGDLDEAARNCGEALRIDPRNPEAIVQRGRVHVLREEWDDAQEDFESALRTDARLVDAHVGLATALEGLGRTERAFGEYEAALRLEPAHEEALLHYGIALHQQRRLEEAAAKYRKTLHVNAENPQAQHLLGTALLEQGRAAAAEQAFREAVRLQPAYSDARYHLALALEQQGRPAEARRQYEEVLRRDPGHAAARQAVAARR